MDSDLERLLVWKLTNGERQEFHDLMDIEMNVPRPLDRGQCLDDYRRFSPSSGEEQFQQLINLSLRSKPS
jgi:hypothetical protein